MTGSRAWDSDIFSKVMVALAKLKEGNYIPSTNRPDSVHLQNLMRIMNDLLRRTEETKKEHARIILADTQAEKLVAGKLLIGDENSVTIMEEKQPGREKMQKVIGTMHTHPGGERALVYGLSDGDYKGFMRDKHHQVMLISYGDLKERYAIMVMKTSVTPNNISPENIKRRIEECNKEFLKNLEVWDIHKFVNFNKAICLEFGLTMYLATPKTRDLFERVNVAV